MKTRMGNSVSGRGNRIVSERNNTLEGKGVVTCI